MTDPHTAQTLSSTAERSYWLGRYLERVDSTAMLLQAFVNLVIDLPLKSREVWGTLVSVTGSSTEFYEHYDQANERNVYRWLINDQRHVGALLKTVALARENARTLQGVIPRQAYEYINELHLLCADQLTEPLSRSRRVDGLTQAVEMAQQTYGFLSGNMLHDDCWRFYRLGLFLERADMTTRIVDLGASTGFAQLPELDAFAELRWRMVLRSRSATQNYRRCSQEPISQASVLDFMLRNPALPSSVSYCISTLSHSLRALPRETTASRALSPLRRMLKEMDAAALSEEEASVLIDQLQAQLAVLHDKITKTYFTPDRRSDDAASSGDAPVRAAARQ
ncbi:MAG: alpha-E domain-containing protein [Pseudomonadota bacterium]